ncbi:hypothetical protein HK104_011182 [Borealophlyctis nickersoniae]|nr:hypothetical protein HK104_011182 [Borealophlyctis nickersoniae]
MSQPSHLHPVASSIVAICPDLRPVPFDSQTSVKEYLSRLLEVNDQVLATKLLPTGSPPTPPSARAPMIPSKPSVQDVLAGHELSAWRLDNFNSYWAQWDLIHSTYAPGTLVIHSTTHTPNTIVVDTSSSTNGEIRRLARDVKGELFCVGFEEKWSEGYLRSFF